MRPTVRTARQQSGDSRRSSRSGLAALVVVAALTLSACGNAAAEKDGEPAAAKVEAIPGTGFSRVTLAAEAAKRIDLKTAKVRAAGSGTEIPYAAVIYSPDGKAWTFIRESGLAFVRKAISVAEIHGEVATLTSGPAVGTDVVTVGAAEVYGAEIGVGDE